MDMNHNCTKLKLRLWDDVYCNDNSHWIWSMRWRRRGEIHWILDNFNLNIPNTVVCIDRDTGWDNPLVKRKRI